MMLYLTVANFVSSHYQASIWLKMREIYLAVGKELQ